MTNRILRPKVMLLLGLLVLLLAGCGGGLPATTWAGLTVDDSVAYLAATDRVVAIDTVKGNVLWTYKFEIPQAGLFGTTNKIIPLHAQPVVSGDMVFVASDGQPWDEGCVLALEASTGKLRWQFPPQGQRPLSNVFAGLAAEKGTLYFAASDQIYALNVQSGEELWHISVGERVWATPVLSGTVLYVSTLGHHLLAVDVTQAGKVLWTFNAGGAIAGSPVLDGNTLYVGAFDNQLYAIDAQTGQKKWSYDTHAWVWDAAVVFKDRVYVGDLGGHVQALDAADGKPLWSQPATVDGAVRANPLYTGEVLLVVTEKGSVYALDPGNGSIRWVARAANARFLTRPLVDNDALLLATLSGPVQLYGVDMAAVPEFYQKQEVGAEGRLPVALYLQDKPNPDVVRWVFSTQSK